MKLKQPRSLQMNRKPQSAAASAAPVQINVDINALREISYLGIRRAADVTPIFASSETRVRVDLNLLFPGWQEAGAPNCPLPTTVSKRDR